MKASHTLENNTENGSDFKQSNLKHEFFFHGNLKADIPARVCSENIKEQPEAKLVSFLT